jgi:hypothetical protein
MKSYIASFVALLSFVSQAPAQTAKLPNAPADVPVNSSAALLESNSVSKTVLEDLLKLQQESLTRLTATVGQLQQLYDEGLIARVELEKAQQDLATAKIKVEQTQSQITSADQLAAEIKKAGELVHPSHLKPVLMAINPTGATVMRSPTGNWSLANLPLVQQFFSQAFGHALPISTIGQSATHNRLGWDHRNSVDIGVHPDSAEGRALMSYLQMAGIPFLAFRAAIPGVATGPHIHIGFPSHRI